MRRELVAALFLSVALTACGGGGSSNGNGSGGGGNSVLPPAPLAITTSSLPQGVQGSSYTTVLKANGGTSPYKWTVAPSLPAGLSLDGDTGAISGIPGSANSYSFTFQVSDSSSPPKSVDASLGLSINTPLSVYDVGVLQLQQWTAPSYRLTAIGGFGGNSLQITGGSLPPGVRMDSQGFLSGAPQTAGTFTFTVTATDSYSPPDTASDTMTAVVSSAPFYIAPSLPQNIPLNRPFSGTIIASGGTPPYTFSASGSLPPGLGPIDPSTGQISGTPTTSGNYFFNVSASDASSPPKTAFQSFQIKVAAPLGRNDSPASATRLGNSTIQASISPFADAPNVSVPDTDYYRIIATAGSTVHVETFAKRYYLNSPLDTVLEITDQNGVQLTTGCNQPGGTTTDFSSPCLNDDVSASPHVQDSMLDYKAPTSTPTQTVLVHVLDWSGNARPDMIYNLQVSGVIDPLVFSSGPGNFYCIINNPCSPFMMVNGGVIPITYSLSAGTLPPGVKLSGNTISGAATSTGTYNYTIQATDHVNQTATLQQTITVVPKLALLTTSLPSATVNIAMTVQLQATGGVPPYFWGIGGVLPANVLASIDGTGKLTYVATQPGTYNIPISISENTTYQQVSTTLPVTITP